MSFGPESDWEKIVDGITYKRRYIEAAPALGFAGRTWWEAVPIVKPSVKTPRDLLTMIQAMNNNG